MSAAGKWLRPPRNVLILFVLIVCIPAATLVSFGIRFLDQTARWRANASSNRWIALRTRAFEFWDRTLRQN